MELMNAGQRWVFLALLAAGAGRALGSDAVASMAQVEPNRTLPAVKTPRTGLEFSANPTAQELSRVRVFEEPLVPIGGEPTAEENAALAETLLGYAQRSGPDDFASLTGFLERHPQSPWRAALQTDLGLEYYNTARYSLALEAWSAAWAHAKGATDPTAKPIADRAAAELAYMYARLGRMTELDALLKSVEGRVFVGSATEKIAGAREGLWNMQHRPEIAFRCGPLALHRIKLATDPQHLATAEIMNSASTQRGCSLEEVAQLSKRIGLNYQMAFRGSGQAFITPSVVHWKVGHYAAMTRREGDRYLLQDPTFGNEVWATRQALESETSGYFLIPPGALPPGWRSVNESEGAMIWGKGNVGGGSPGGTGGCDPGTPPANSCSAPCMPNGGFGDGAGGGGGDGGGDDGGDGESGGDSASDEGFGMAVSSVNFMLVNLSISDIPVGYAPPVGPTVRFRARYSYRDAFQPGTFTYSNFGPKWTCDWISYITDNPQSLSADVTHYLRGGGTRTFTGFDPVTQSFASQQYDQTLLTRTGPSSYELLSGNASRMIFSQPDGSIGSSRKVFLTQIVDPYGNTVTLSYDASLRLTTITDAIGQVTTLSYGLTTDIYKITRVTDPFGRFAVFEYDGANRLSKITDVIGLSSQFTYEGSGDFINSLITPYGTNSFTRGESGTTRWLETLYPDGSRERVEFNQTIGIPMSDPATAVPTGMATYNNYLGYRNTFYWNRTACATGYGDYTKARIYHWLHTADLASAAGIIESVKAPLENRAWYDYSGQSSSLIVGANNRPTHVGRVLDDGSTQLYTYAYDGFGHVTNMVDPAGRTYSFVYASNGIDLLEIRQTRAGNNDLLAKMSYNAQHLPLTITGSSGQTTTNTYNARGQILTRTNPKRETTTYTYDSSGYLIAVDGPLPGTSDLVTATYDAYGRTRTMTDEDGYTVTYDYDALNRLVKTTFPDATFSQTIFDRLDTIVTQDRAGRQTSMEYDRMRQLTRITDPLGRVTRFEWCSCGDLKSLTDPMGRTTTWNKDIQGRTISKEFGDGSQVRYSYETATSRMRQVVDEKQQVTTYSYGPDNTLISTAFVNGTGSTPNVRYTYDRNYLRVMSMTDGTGTTLYTYNPITVPPTLGAGLLSSEDGPFPNDTITFGYDELGRRVSTSINGVTMRKTYDAANRVIGETNALGSFSYTYDGVSPRVLALTSPNGLTMTRSYGDNLHDRVLQQISHTVGATPVSQFNYSRDIPAGRIAAWTQQAQALPASTYTFGYDAANQLLSAVVTNSGTLVSSFGYSYDPAGNRLTEQTNGMTNPAAYNALNQLSAITSGGGALRTNEWDADDRLVAVNSGNQRTEFAYDGVGRVVQIRLLTNNIEASRRRLVWQNRDICEERDGAGTVTKRFFAQGMRVETGTNAGNYYYTLDHLGSIREITDASGNVRARYAYDPFGQSTKVAGDMDADFGYTGLFRERSVALDFARFRAYDSRIGRWLSRDPLRSAEVEQGPNLYAYVGNNPINLVDPLGLCCEKEAKDAARADEVRYRKCKFALTLYNSICRGSLRNDPQYAYADCEETRQKALQTCRAANAGLNAALKQLGRCQAKPCRKGSACLLPPFKPFFLAPPEQPGWWREADLSDLPPGIY